MSTFDALSFLGVCFCFHYFGFFLNFSLLRFWNCKTFRMPRALLVSFSVLSNVEIKDGIIIMCLLKYLITPEWLGIWKESVSPHFHLQIHLLSPWSPLGISEKIPYVPLQSHFVFTSYYFYTIWVLFFFVIFFLIYRFR